ncbi:hypothetical protein RvY_00936 [Ramazzottius varieornatus]|uniref:Transmembrane protein 192 n=1 Tax=Ramazzottius varieornatus TaxID=947166 RepID=A0A1D1UKM4_RAMVA|nr:hypothetical protein RvY_00936 [Ramazzottius varieornatus]
MVSLNSDTSFRTALSDDEPRSRTMSRAAARSSDAAHRLLPDPDAIAFWDMSAAGMFASTVALNAGDEEGAYKFRSVPAVPVVSFIILLVVLDVIFSFVLPVVCPVTCSGVTAFSWISYLQIILFFAILLADSLLRRIHSASRSLGYLEFYRRTRKYRKLPVIIVATASCIFLFAAVMTEQFCPDQVRCGAQFTRADILQIVCCLQAAVLIPLCFRYIYISRQFNKARALPDVLQDNLNTERILQSSANIGQRVGVKEEGFKENLLEKQADEILYLRKRNAFLSSRILDLTTQLNSSTGHQTV